MDDDEPGGIGTGDLGEGGLQRGVEPGSGIAQQRQVGGHPQPRRPEQAEAVDPVGAADGGDDMFEHGAGQPRALGRGERAGEAGFRPFRRLDRDNGPDVMARWSCAHGIGGAVVRLVNRMPAPSA